jgi:hypothetical protein
MLQALMHGEETGRQCRQEVSGRAVRPNREFLIRQVDGVNAFGFLDPSRRICGILRSPCGVNGPDTFTVLNQDRTPIDHNGLAGGESFLHQKQIGSCNVMSFADSPHRQPLAHAFKELLPF